MLAKFPVSNQAKENLHKHTRIHTHIEAKACGAATAAAAIPAMHVWEIDIGISAPSHLSFYVHFASAI